jgi:hypothetical protein
MESHMTYDLAFWTKHDEAFAQGRRAFRSGLSNIDNPYVGEDADDALNEAWNDGWFDALDEQNERFF